MKNTYITNQNKIFLPDSNWNNIAEIAFEKINDTTYDIYHTIVDESMRWQGIADDLVRTARDYIEGQWFSVTASCPFAKKWLKGHKYLQ